MKRRLIIAILFIVSLTVFSQPQAPFNKGVNLTSWFQANSVGQIQFLKYTYDDFVDIKSLGVDVIRLPISLHFMTDGEPNYSIEPLFFQFLDTVVNRCEALNLHLIIDNHTFDPSIDTDPEISDALKKVWSQMAMRYKDRGNIYYEVLNEPHGIEDDVWNAIQGEVITEIRKYDTKHAIIVGPANWNSFHNLDQMPEYADTNLIYTFHFYDPFLFTHQGATWVDPSMDEVTDIPFPYDEASMPEVPEKYVGTWIEDRYNDYSVEGTQENLESLLQIAVDFSIERNVPVFGGEFGVLMNNCTNQDRVNWYGIVADFFGETNVAWTSWDYHDAFGVFELGGNDLFDHDLNIPLLEAMGFNTPEQTEYVLKPDTVGFGLYLDYIDNTISSTSWGIESVNYYCENEPNNGQFCLEVREIPLYQNVAFDFKGVKDLSLLNSNEYALDLMIRCNRTAKGIDLRFVDTHILDSNDIPWRMSYRVMIGYSEGDLGWHHLHIPLSDFYETGGWDGEWNDPVGLFDWTAIDRFEIVAETDIQDATFWFDNIHITNLDTALVYNQTIIEDPYPDEGISVSDTFIDDIRFYPNPVKDNLFVETKSNSSMTFTLANVSGVELQTWSFKDVKKIKLDLSTYSEGIYFIKLDDGISTITKKIFIK